MKLFLYLKKLLPYYTEFSNFHDCGMPVNYSQFLKLKIFPNELYWFKEKNCKVMNPRTIFVGINSNIGRDGNYIQGAGTIIIGNYVRIANNVGLLSANHDLYDQKKYNLAPIKIGDYSWVGMNSIITAGVELGPRTIVGAGSVVTKSFPEGYCIIAGNPARIVKMLEKERFTPWLYDHEFYGYIPKEKFEILRKKYIDI